MHALFCCCVCSCFTWLRGAPPAFPRLGCSLEPAQHWALDGLPIHTHTRAQAKLKSSTQPRQLVHLRPCPAQHTSACRGSFPSCMAGISRRRFLNRQQTPSPSSSSTLPKPLLGQSPRTTGLHTDTASGAHTEPTDSAGVCCAAECISCEAGVCGSAQRCDPTCPPASLSIASDYESIIQISDAQITEEVGLP